MIRIGTLVYSVYSSYSCSSCSVLCGTGYSTKKQENCEATDTQTYSCFCFPLKNFSGFSRTISFLAVALLTLSSANDLQGYTNAIETTIR